MPLDQGREGLLGRVAVVRREPLQELPVGQFPERSDREQRSQLPQDAAILSHRQR
jgi:hypothetical protein